MKLLYCERCEDVFKLTVGEMRFCSCGLVYGRYLDNVTAEVSKHGVSIAIGNGSFQMAISKMRVHQKNTKDTADREEYQTIGQIPFAWVRPNSGKGNPHTKVCEQDIRPMQLVDVRLIEPTNTKLKESVVAQIVKDGWQPEKGKALPAWWSGTRWLLTDGNHRLEALKRLGEKYAPLAELTKEEFDHIKFSKNHIDFTVFIPEKPRMWIYKDEINKA